eukprot:765047-Hanusia_phi.AAC.2
MTVPPGGPGGFRVGAPGRQPGPRGPWHARAAAAGQLPGGGVPLCGGGRGLSIAGPAGGSWQYYHSRVADSPREAERGAAAVLSC